MRRLRSVHPLECPVAFADRPVHEHETPMGGLTFAPQEQVFQHAGHNPAISRPCVCTRQVRHRKCVLRKRGNLLKSTNRPRMPASARFSKSVSRIRQRRAGKQFQRPAHLVWSKYSCGAQIFRGTSTWLILKDVVRCDPVPLYQLSACLVPTLSSAAEHREDRSLTLAASWPVSVCLHPEASR